MQRQAAFFSVHRVPMASACWPSANPGTGPAAPPSRPRCLPPLRAVDADPSRAAGAAAAGDVISRLVGIYGSKELFINEFRWGQGGAGGPSGVG